LQGLASSHFSISPSYKLFWPSDIRPSIQGMLTGWGRLSMVDLLVKIAHFVKKINNVLISKTANLNW